MRVVITQHTGMEGAGTAPHLTHALDTLASQLHLQPDASSMTLLTARLHLHPARTAEITTGHITSLTETVIVLALLVTLISNIAWA